MNGNGLKKCRLTLAAISLFNSMLILSIVYIPVIVSKIIGSSKTPKKTLVNFILGIALFVCISSFVASIIKVFYIEKKERERGEITVHSKGMQRCCSYLGILIGAMVLTSQALFTVFYSNESCKKSINMLIIPSILDVISVLITLAIAITLFTLAASKYLSRKNKQCTDTLCKNDKKEFVANGIAFFLSLLFFAGKLITMLEEAKAVTIASKDVTRVIPLGLIVCASAVLFSIPILIIKVMTIYKEDPVNLTDAVETVVVGADALLAPQ